jgi:sodium transport system permease protein
MDLRQIWILYRHEVRSALRDRSIVVTSIIIPLVMYPLLLWAAFAGLNFVQGQADRLTARVAVLGLPDAHRSLLDSLVARDAVTLVPWSGTPDEADEAVARGRLDAVLHVEDPVPGGAALDGNFSLRLTVSTAQGRSERAGARIEDAVADYRKRWVDRVRPDLGLDDPSWARFAVVREDVSTPEESTRFFLAVVVPMLTLIMVALASFYPAIDATAGERERSTWETLMTVAAPRGNVAAAKYLYVATFGAAGGLLNVAALVLSLRWILTPVAGPDDIAGGGLPLSTLPLIGLGTFLLGLFVAAGMLVFAVFARNFKEGQAAITPFYMVIILPAILLQSPDLALTERLALIPVVNVVLLLRAAIQGSVPLLAGGITLASMAVTVALAVMFAQWVMRREDVLMGSAGEGLGGFLRKRFQARRSEA